jgi:16S rRNA (cytosine967-C5)-methyltransferase
MAAAGADVVACDLRPRRLALVADNARRLGADLALVVVDGRSAPFRAGSFDRVLVDAPCSGLGVLRRRADARWRDDPATGGRGDASVLELAELQVALLDAAADLVRPGGLLVYSVCTMTEAETAGVDRRFRAIRPGAEPVPVSSPWRPHGDGGTGGLLLPQDLDSEGMAVFRYRMSGSGSGSAS